MQEIWLGKFKKTGKCRTHGELTGVKTDSSDWQRVTLAESARMESFHSSEVISIITTSIKISDHQSCMYINNY